MYKSGYENLTNVDYSKNVITQMAARTSHMKKMKWEVMDVTDLKYPDESFDLAIDKSTIDALLCGDNAFINVAKMLKEAQRVLKPGGVYLAISYGKPEN